MATRMMQFDVVTIFPELFPGPLGVGIVGKGIQTGLLSISCHNLRDFAHDRHRSVDDAPYGGGPGMLMKPDPVFECLEYLGHQDACRILLSPQGTLFTQDLASRLTQNHQRFILICGRYEGVDERIREHCCDLDLSIGNYVLAGGEIAAMVVIETISRLIPGVVGDQQSVETDSLSGNLLKFPQYTRPSDFRGFKVPSILMSGNHEEIRQWRHCEALKRTQRHRPDLFTCKEDGIGDT